MGSRDRYWLSVCNTIAENTKCLSIKIGVVVVKDDRYILSTGYNGPPAGSRHCDDLKYRQMLFDKNYGVEGNKLGYHAVVKDDIKLCPRGVMGFKSGEGLEYCQSAHAERNAIAVAARLGHSLEGATMYMNCGIPCFECAKSIINSGISNIVVRSDFIYDKKGLSGLDILMNGGIKIRVMEGVGDEKGAKHRD